MSTCTAPRASARRVRFERDERFLLQPLAPRPYTSLVPLPCPIGHVAAGAARGINVEKRSWPPTISSWAVWA
jgi:hypothetical protein